MEIETLNIVCYEWSLQVEVKNCNQTEFIFCIIGNAKIQVVDKEIFISLNINYLIVFRELLMLPQFILLHPWYILICVFLCFRIHYVRNVALTILYI